MQPMGSDAEIVGRVLAGERAAFAEIVRRYQDRVFRLACSILGGQAAAEDAAQEAFLKAFDGLSGFRSQSKFSTWLYRIAANHCLNLLDKRNRRREESLDALLERPGGSGLAAAPDPGAALEARQMAQAALARLRPQERAVLVLREWEGLSYRELAEALQVSLGAAKLRLFRARRALIEQERRDAGRNNPRAGSV